MTSAEINELTGLAVIAIICAVLYARSPWRPSQTACGRARWASLKDLAAKGMLGVNGLILARELERNKVIRLPDACHTLVVGGTGSGKGVSCIFPQLLSQRCSIIAHDMKSDLARLSSGARRAMGQQVIRLAPLNGGRDSLNPLDAIDRDSPLLVDQSRALATALVVRPETEADPHWADKSIQVVTSLLVLVLLKFERAERNIVTVAELASNETLLAEAADQLIAIGGVPGRLGSQLQSLFSREESKQGTLSKEGSSVLSCVQRYLAPFDSALVAQAVSSSTFNPADLLTSPGITVFIEIGAEHLEAQKGLLRFWFAALFRAAQTHGEEQTNKVLCLIDEASAINGLSALEEALVRGRSSGIRLYLVYQSDSQVTSAYKNKPTLIYDNCNTHIYLGGASSIEGAQRLSPALGQWTQVTESFNQNESRSRSPVGVGSHGGSDQINTSRGRSYQVQSRDLMRPEELLVLSRDRLIALIPGMCPIIANRVKYYADPLFGTARTPIFRPRLTLRQWVWALIVVGVMVWICVKHS